jgi:L-lactate utilization protein LutB
MSQKELARLDTPAGVIDQLKKMSYRDYKKRADLMDERTEIEQLREEMADLKLKMEKSEQLVEQLNKVAAMGIELLWEMRK